MPSKEKGMHKIIHCMVVAHCPRLEAVEASRSGSEPACVNVETSAYVSHETAARPLNANVRVAQ